MISPHKLLLLTALATTGYTTTSRAVEVSFQENVTGVATDDTLQDVLPLMSENGVAKNNGVPTSGLVDGGGAPTVWLIGPGRPDNGLLIGFYPGPVRFVWDLQSDSAELNKLSVAMYAGRGGNFGGQWSVSKDGQNFEAIPGTRVTKQFPAKPEEEAMKVLNRVDFKFAPGEVKGNRYLCLELFGHIDQFCEILEVDGWINGANPTKTTAINTQIRSIAKSQITTPLPDDQTKTPPMKVLGPRFSGTQLQLPARDNLAVLDFKKLLATPGADWKILKNTVTKQQVTCIQRRNDGLERTLRLTVNTAGLLKLRVDVQLPKGSPRPVKYGTTSLAIDEASVPFDGVVWGSGAGPILVERSQSTKAEIGERTPYVIYPSKDKKLEVQVFLPNWYGAKGRLTAFNENTMFACDLLAAVKNTVPRDMRGEKPDAAANRWLGTDKEFRPGDKLGYELNITVFDNSAPKPLGQLDIETTDQFASLTGVEAGTGTQTAHGQPRILQRDKMRFIGFNLPAQPRQKLGHQIQIEPGQNTVAWLDRLKKSGVGFVNLTSEYRDVCHGVSYNNSYELAPPGFREELKKIKNAGIVSTVWFTPNAFLGADIPTAKRDRIVDEHPDWFTGTAHWFGMHQTINIYNPEPKLWSLNKIKSDLTKYPEIGGIYFDMFPWVSPPQVLNVGQESGLTGFQNEQAWVRKYYAGIKSFGKDKVFMGNGSTPAFDEHNFSDYGGSEHPLNMFLNEVLPGQISFGHPFVQWERYGGLYFWYPLLGQMYYNFCDYDQAVGYVGTKWVGWEDGQMKKDFEKEVAPYWYITGKANRTFGAQIAPLVRQIEAKMPNGKTVVLVTSLSSTATDVTILPRNVKPGQHRVTATIDTAREHKQTQFALDLKAEGIAIAKLPPYSIVRFEFDS
jgi:hypothetical protein